VRLYLLIYDTTPPLPHSTYKIELDFPSPLPENVLFLYEKIKKE
jgi:hypothetical protein